jgi:CAAX protease family protein
MRLGLFWNPEERRWRAGWRLAFQLVVFATVLAGVAVLSKSLGPGPGAAILAWLTYLLAGVGSVGLLARFVDRRPFADFGFHLSGGWWLDFAFGLVLGGVMLSGVFATELAAGWIQVVGGAASSESWPIGVAVFVKGVEWIAVGVNEELVFRGYQLRNLAEGLAGRRLDARTALSLAVVASSVLFGLAHLANGHASFMSTLNIVLGGLLLSLPLLLTGELAISIGLHISWNLFEGTIYGFAVSGVPPKTHLLTIEQTGPDLWTGGAFGPEAGLVSILWMLIAGGLVAAWVRRRQPLEVQAAHGPGRMIRSR